MREPNISYTSQNRPAVCITSGVYDRRALDCTATVPLINSLTHLAYLTSTSPRIREILVSDGGLERLVRILSTFDMPEDRRHLWKWSLAFQCVVNIGVRGTEQIRTRVVEAGAVHVVLRLLENYDICVQHARMHNFCQGKSTQAAPFLVFGPTETRGWKELYKPAPPADAIAHMLSSSSSSIYPSASNKSNTSNSTFIVSPQNSSDSSSSTNLPTSSRRVQRARPSIANPHRRSTFPYIKIDPAQRRQKRLIRVPANPVPEWRDPKVPNIDNLFYREEDILLSLQLLAYLSKYPHIRNVFYSAYPINVFRLVERFCHKIHGSSIQYWAGVIMRNACRKDETRGSIRRCANMQCNKWEKQQREFAKCRRCRKAKYCSKACQSQAWQDGHRYWCIDRSDANPAVESTAAGPRADTTTAHIGHGPVTNNIGAGDRQDGARQQTTQPPTVSNTPTMNNMTSAAVSSVAEDETVQSVVTTTATTTRL